MTHERRRSAGEGRDPRGGRQHDGDRAGVNGLRRDRPDGPGVQWYPHHALCGDFARPRARFANSAESLQGTAPGAEAGRSCDPIVEFTRRTGTGSGPAAGARAVHLPVVPQ
ncbi:hypothetical protein PSA01_13810 [Pseudonocardia saturnea]|uniref:Uncharacterized protein n=1 Tax=Pseudonocardia saturnea TaxID=33909 RepID=A0ABQ0RUJ3_9PSEU|nr:hypothetical protein Pdca_18910 [Pseudonocardia autotrophica]GEC24352.1 hypothetical protein PSA01_13810 [Pseudonocardia saturnea]